MKTFLKFMRLEFLPASPDLGLLVLRLWFGLSLLCIHGWGKLTGFSTLVEHFPGLLGMNPHLALGLATFAETLCALCVALGLFTRLAALILCIHFTVAFMLVHHFALKAAPGSGEPAFIYLAGFVTILIAGAGRFALDAVGRKKPA